MKILTLSFKPFPSSVSNLDLFIGLKSLVLDHNELISKQDFPHIPTLETLWVNANNIDSLEVFLDGIQHAFPKLNYLSMLKNPCCPNYFVGKDSAAYQKYRYNVLARIPGLKFLDASPITLDERTEAQKIAATTARPDQSQYGRGSGAPIVDEALALPATDPNAKGPTTFGVAKYVYYGRQSEGNRFIVDSQL
jgi:hypothetical protein